jgi:hypothetical protein
MKINHYSIFSQLSTDNIDWNRLRDSDLEQSYHIPFNKNDYLLLIQNSNFDYYIDAILNYCKEHNINKIVSIGSGRCGLEYHLKSKSDLSVVVTDTSDSILRIKKFNIFDDAYKLNLLNNPNELDVDSKTLILLSRIDTEFDDNNFRELFSILKNKNVKYITLIPAELLSIKIIFAEFKILLISILNNKKRVFCGFARSKSEFRNAWSNHYQVENKYSTNKIFQLIQKLK